MTRVAIPTARGPMPGYVAEPPGAGSAAGVVLVHDVVGMSSDLRRQAEWLASEGFLAVAPDLFHWSGHARCLLASARDYLRRRGRIFDDIEATRGWLNSQARCSGRIAVLGFCFGGGFAVLVAADGTYAASSVNYGLVPRDAERVLAAACPIIGSFGEKDPAMAASARRLADLATRDPRHEVTVYDGAGHAFLNDHDPDEVPAVLRLTDRLSGGTAAYQPHAAGEARRRIAAFLRRHLEQPASA
jgi:carboxymethylenebutenolidase